MDVDGDVRAYMMVEGIFEVGCVNTEAIMYNWKIIDKKNKQMKYKIVHLTWFYYLEIEYGETEITVASETVENKLVNYNGSQLTALTLTEKANSR